VLAWESAVVDKSLVLVNAGCERNIVVLAPATEGMEQKDWVLVTLLDKLLTGVLEKENVTIMKGVAYLEGVDCISTASFNEVTDFRWSVPVLVHAIAESDTFGEVHA